MQPKELRLCVIYDAKIRPFLYIAPNTSIARPPFKNLSFFLPSDFLKDGLAIEVFGEIYKRGLNLASTLAHNLKR